MICRKDLRRNWIIIKCSIYKAQKWRKIFFQFWKSWKYLFYSFHSESGLPLPRHLPRPFKKFLSVILTANLIYGFKLRKVILSNLPETKLGPIDYLIWMDQTNGLFLAIVSIVRLTHNEPLGSAEQNVGRCLLPMDRPSKLPLHRWGRRLEFLHWSLQSPLHQGATDFGEKTLLRVLLLVGCLLAYGVSFCQDSKNTTERVCFQYSNEDIDIIMNYQVRGCGLLEATVNEFNLVYYCHCPSKLFLSI